MRHIKELEKFKTNTNVKFEDGEWWYKPPCGIRRRVTTTIKKNDNRMYVNGKYIPRDHPLWKAGRFRNFEDVAFSSLEGYTKTLEGYVYIVKNPAWKNWIKVGMAIDAEDRCNQYQTSSPFRDFNLIHSRFFKNRKEAEQEVHSKLKEVASEFNGEWFKLPCTKAKKIIEEL